MSTNDVPGANPANYDKLGHGCWAETASGDGSYVLVQSTENGRVVYEIFDTNMTPVQAYRGMMSEDQFKKQFSFDSKDRKSVKWTWHDKTPFPWSIIVSKGLQPGQRPAMATDLLAEADAIRASMGRLGIPDDDDLGSAAARVAADLGLRARGLAPEDIGKWRRAAGHIVTGFQNAIAELDT